MLVQSAVRVQAFTSRRVM